jgi:hypothetical protein
MSSVLFDETMWAIYAKKKAGNRKKTKALPALQKSACIGRYSNRLVAIIPVVTSLFINGKGGQIVCGFGAGYAFRQSQHQKAAAARATMAAGSLPLRTDLGVCQRFAILAADLAKRYP